MYICNKNLKRNMSTETATITAPVSLTDGAKKEIKKLIPGLKKIYSSSLLNSLQKNAEQTQKWPLLNLVRQILNNHGYKMEPFRKADGYTLDGIKKYKRFFVITHKVEK